MKRTFLMEIMGGNTEVLASCAICGWSGTYYYGHPFPLEIIHTCKPLAPIEEGTK